MFMKLYFNGKLIYNFINIWNNPDTFIQNEEASEKTPSKRDNLLQPI